MQTYGLGLVLGCLGSGSFRGSRGGGSLSLGRSLNSGSDNRGLLNLDFLLLCGLLIRDRESHSNRSRHCHANTAHTATTAGVSSAGAAAASRTARVSVGFTSSEVTGAAGVATTSGADIMVQKAS